MPQHRNILELQHALEDFADNSLAQEAQNPSGVYPLYLVIAEIQRRTDMRERFAANEQMANLSLPSIAQQKVAELEGVPSVDPGVNQGSDLSPEVMNQGIGSLNQLGVPSGDMQQLASLPPGAMQQQVGPSPVGMQQQFGQGVGGFSQPQPVSMAHGGIDMSMAHGGIVDLPGRLPEQEYGPQEKPLTREEVRRERMNAAWRRRLFQALGIDVPESPSSPFMDPIPGLTEDIGVRGPFPFMPSEDPFGEGIHRAELEAFRERGPARQRPGPAAQQQDMYDSGLSLRDRIRINDPTGGAAEGVSGGLYGSWENPPTEPMTIQVEEQTEMDRLLRSFGIDPGARRTEIEPFDDIPGIESGIRSDWDTRIAAITEEQVLAEGRATKADKESLRAFRAGAESKEKSAKRLSELYEGRMGEGPTAYETGLSDIMMSPEARARESKAYMLAALADTLGTATQPGDIATGLGGVTRGLIDYKKAGREEDIRVLGELGRLEQARKDRVFDASRGAIEAAGVASDASNSIAMFAAEQGRRLVDLAQDWAEIRESARELGVASTAAARGTDRRIAADLQLEHSRRQADADRIDRQMDTQIQVALIRTSAAIEAAGGNGASWGTWTSVMGQTSSQIDTLNERLGNSFFDYDNTLMSKENDQIQLQYLSALLQKSTSYWLMAQTGQELPGADYWPTAPELGPGYPAIEALGGGTGGPGIGADMSYYFGLTPAGTPPVDLPTIPPLSGMDATDRNRP